MTKTKACSTCGATFEAVKAPSGKWPATCSLSCRVDAIDRLIASLQRSRDALIERLEDGEV